MEKVKSIISTFFDLNAFSLKRVLIAIGFLAAFFILKGLLSTLIIKIFKIKGRENIKNNSFYKPLRIFFSFIGFCIGIQFLGPTPLFQSILKKCFRIVVILLLTYSVGNMVGPNSRFEKSLKKRLNRTNDAMIKMICKGIRLLIYFIGFVILVSELGYNISGLITGLGIGGVALALAAQDTAKNIIGAIMIVIDKPFEVGDWVTIGTTEGSVEEFTFRSVRIREGRNCVVSIPNSTVVDSAITNWSKLQKRRILFNLVLEFNTPLKKVADVQNDILIYLEQEEKIINEGMYVKFSEIVDDGYNLKVFCFTPILNYAEYMDFMDKVNFKVMSILQKHKVELAYKSQTVYLKQ